ncbi:hypothetical protein JTE90_003657 [Oedothorax gibbosus]|uniref:Uncharacterized protein n=1 Tax=Oedothorax gibbosus TaxID=931172 RepID=A0AAV6VRJ1_9ARAC|nr:hypothetical protein JTE90_003657 [Oedothorax gibbosus]
MQHFASEVELKKYPNRLLSTGQVIFGGQRRRRRGKECGVRPPGERMSPRPNLAPPRNASSAQNEHFHRGTRNRSLAWITFSSKTHKKE